MLFALALAITACGKKPPVLTPTVVEVVKTVEVRIPVLVRPTAPPELLAPVETALPEFVPPSDPEASSALRPDGERNLLALIALLLARIAALQELFRVKD